MTSADDELRGVRLALGSAFSFGTATVAPREDEIADVRYMITWHREHNKMSRADASVLRGKAGFLASQLHGKVFGGLSGHFCRDNTTSLPWN